MQMNIDIEYLGGPQVKALNLTDAEIIAAVERGLDAAGRGQTVIGPRTHLKPDAGTEGHFNILRGYIEPLDLAGVKIVGDFVDNYKNGLPSEMALLNLFCPRTGMPRAVIDAAGITDMRTGALTAIGAKHLAPPNPKRLGHIGARGTAYWNVRLLCLLYTSDAALQCRHGADPGQVCDRNPVPSFARQRTNKLQDSASAVTGNLHCQHGDPNKTRPHPVTPFLPAGVRL